ncbi:hypothetical protein [Okeania sp. SIO1I7]|uniref:hypothetical protein n=1 Tax=Okeania sp. SIO1I7 TaxID=2607772 RepID=UPI0025E68647|nr:hypothetical protein [Okeania sp. SIO1I7]
MYGCQQHLVESSPEVMAILEYLCTEANKLTNCGIYYCRQMLFKAGRFLSKAELDFELKNNPHFKAMRLLRNASANSLCPTNTALCN